MLRSSEIKKRLIALAGLIAEQSAKDSEFATALAELLSAPGSECGEPESTFDQLVVTSIDPFIAREERGADGFRSWIDSQSNDQLKAIISEHRLDATGNARKWKTKEKLVELIIDRVESRSKQGGVFRRYGEHGNVDAIAGPAADEPNKAVNPNGGSDEV